jgi:response regulator RpfG family c-di-GMP phosphodiesterase
MSVTTKPGSILICDDSREDADFLCRVLADHGYSRLRVITDPCQVIPLLENESFDLLLLDIGAPCSDGASLTRHIRERYSEARLPILVITASSAAETRNRELAEGANDYLTKPIDPNEMPLRVRNLLAINSIYKAQQATESRLECEVRARTEKLDLLIKNGIMLSMARDRSQLLQQILVEGRSLLNCDGATLYLLTEQNTLRFALRTRHDTLPTVEIPLYDAGTGKPNESHVSTWVALHNKSVVIDDVYQETRFDLSGTRRFDRETQYRTVSMLTVPMASSKREVIGVVQFMNALDPDGGAIIPFSGGDIALVEALAAQAAVALDNLQLLEAQESLMDNLFQVIATAIDAKSPYTGRHCSRVPELAVMLAEAAHADRAAFAEFSFDTPEEWREFKIGAWLHDCGKVATPEYVIDKATKLETINNRIHEVRTRFEVLLRDAEIERLLALQRGEDAAQANSRYAERKAELTDDFGFVARCNTGTGPVADADIDRLGRIASTRWLRNFDDRIGVSHAELERCQFPEAEPVLPLPAWEQLLADKPRHVFPRDAAQVPDPIFGFKVDIPENLYNHGEIYNLAVRSGTLTEEERYKINEHMVCTIMMLEQMRFPKSLRRVPEYAGTHHETINGNGYPRRLAGSELSVPARIMAIADIFEALTAPDRPYKEPNTVSEAIKVLHGLKMSGNIDADLFDLFLSSGLYLRYADTFLNPEQIDAVDISAYLGPLSA